MDATAQYDAGMFMLKAKSKYPIKAVGRDREPIPLADVTHGSKARAQVAFHLYDIGGRKGISAYLNGVQLVEGASSDQWPDDLPDMLEDDYVDAFNK
jgi:hypothetical protein